MQANCLVKRKDTVWSNFMEKFLSNIRYNLGMALFRSQELLPSETLAAVTDRSLTEVHKAAIRKVVVQRLRTLAPRSKRTHTPSSSLSVLHTS